MKKVIPAAPGYEMSADGKVFNKATGTPVFPDKATETKVMLYNKDKKRVEFVVAKLVEELFGKDGAVKADEKPAAEKTKAAKEPAAKPAKAVKAEGEGKKPGRTGSIISEIQALFAKGKDKVAVIALGKYNKSTVGVQWGKFNKANPTASKPAAKAAKAKK